MSEAENQETNGISNGDVPEIELIIKAEIYNAHEPFKEDLNLSDMEEFEDLKPAQLQPEEYTLPNVQQSLNDLVNEAVGYDTDCALNILSKSDIKLENNDKTDLTLSGVVKEDRNCGIEFAQQDMEKPTCSQRDSINNALLTKQMNLYKLVEEACDDNFEDIENDLDLNLSMPVEEMETIDSTAHCSNKRGKTARKFKAEDLERAEHAVLEEGMSLGQASKKFNVAKSTIWVRVSRNPKHRARTHDGKLCRRIYRKLKAGISIAEISRVLHVAKSTVHQHKMRLFKNDMLPSSVMNTSQGSTGKYAVGGSHHDVMEKAYRAHRVNGLSVRFAAQMYSLPLTTLWRYIKQAEAAKHQPENNKAADTGGEKVTENLQSENINCELNNVVETGDDVENGENVNPQLSMKLDPDEQEFLEQALLDTLFDFS
ncbi:uncharacterized protein LOC119671863 isoform X1 [Teleopsis dalmanni]|uniref:uncharacterized protein LOC119671863 isoform X1 n=1 Tax=Teleopsis dalmanni TaxID=139649 RepID=UPI0018CF4CFC|nr:uncharacterized protein LOC119671863 isoform X1 [Teleopsis dalmanni]